MNVKAFVFLFIILVFVEGWIIYRLFLRMRERSLSRARRDASALQNELSPALAELSKATKPVLDQEKLV